MEDWPTSTNDIVITIGRARSSFAGAQPPSSAKLQPSGFQPTNLSSRYVLREEAPFTDNQILAILKQAETGTPVPQLCREHGMSSASFYRWRAKDGGMHASAESLIAHLA